MAGSRSRQQHDEQPEVPEGHVALALANPMSAKVAEACRVHGEIRDYGVNEKIVVTRDYGLALIEAGQVQVDPHDRKNVRRVLGLNAKMQPLTDEELARQEKNPSELATAPVG